VEVPRRRTTQKADGQAARRRLELLAEQLAAEERLAAERDGDLEPGTEGQPVDVARQEDERTVPQTGAAARHRASALSGRDRLAAQMHDRLPGRWQSLLGRGLTPQHIVVVVGVLAVLGCVTVWWVISAAPSTVTPVANPVGSAATPAPDAASDAGSEESSGESGAPSEVSPAPPAATPTQVVVDVSGKVREPGIVTLPPGSRVADALDSAGGPRPGAKLDTLNLARVLVDGEQIVVGLPPADRAGSAAVGSSGGAPDASVAPVNLNAATQEQLESLPGVGPVTASAILEWRTEHGRFSSVDELLEVKGIGDATLADLRDRVTV